MKTRRIFLNLINCFASLICLSAYAKDYDWNGFLAQGIIQAEDSNFINSDGDISLRLTEVGVNGFYRLNNKLRLAAQAVYLNGADRYPEGTRLDYLFLDWNLVSKPSWQLNLHLGRFKNYHWLYSATRDVPHTRPSIILPQSVYFDVFRDVALGSDGISLLASAVNTYGEWDIFWSYGNSPISQEQMRNLLRRDANGKLEQDFVHQFNLTWRPPQANYQLGINLLDSDFEYRAAPAEPVFDGDATSQRIMLMFRYFSEFWEFSSEIQRERAIYNDVVFPGFQSDLTSESAYFQGIYRLTNDVSLLARLDLYDRDRKDRNGRIFSLTSGGIIPPYFAFADQATLGITWQPYDKWQIQAEVHRVKGAGRLAPILEPDVLTNQKYWNIWAVQVSHWF